MSGAGHVGAGRGAWRFPASEDATICVVGLSVRERIEELERSCMSGWATLSSQSKGRERGESPDPLRTVFQVDRDRILYCAAFRRLRDKTHCFIPARDADADPPFRTRLTHTLTAAQIGRTIARGLRANEDLVEAIALGSDLGGTPYGEAGEEALATMLKPPFRHDEQSLRIVEVLENSGRGLNLSWEVRDGILHHSWSMPPAATLEGQIVRLATRIALVTHDLADAFRAGLVSRDELPSAVVSVLGASAGDRVSTLVRDVIETSEGTPEVRFGNAVDEAQRRIAQFMEERIFSAEAVLGERDRAVHVVRSLVVFLMETPDWLRGAVGDGDDLEQRVVDHLSGLSDRAIGRLFTQTFMPGDRPR